MSTHPIVQLGRLTIKVGFNTHHPPQTFGQGKSQRFGILTLLTKIRWTNVFFSPSNYNLFYHAWIWLRTSYPSWTLSTLVLFFFIQGRSELGQAQTNLIKVVIYKFYGEILTKCNIRIRLLQIAMSTSMGTYWNNLVISTRNQI